MLIGGVVQANLEKIVGDSDTGKEGSNKVSTQKASKTQEKAYWNIIMANSAAVFALSTRVVANHRVCKPVSIQKAHKRHEKLTLIVIDNDLVRHE
jgi:hypothetical protein